MHFQGRKFEGLVYTGANVSVISPSSSPSSWPKHPNNVGPVGVGKEKEVYESLFISLCTGPDGQKGTIQHYITPIPINLWGEIYWHNGGLKFIFHTILILLQISI